MSSIELCCVCGLVIRHDALGIRLAKAHYHWASSALPLTSGFEPTICAEHLGTIAMWAVAREATRHDWQTPYGNATLPSYCRSKANALLMDALLSNLFGVWACDDGTQR